MASLKRILSVVFIVLVLLSLLWFAGGKTVADQFVARFLTESKDEFAVPAAKMPLNVAVTQDREQVTVCNRGTERWDGTLIPLNRGYVAKKKSLGAGDCARIKETSFPSNNRKQPPAAQDHPVTHAAI